MLRPEVRYARADDGVAIAYSVVGDGPVTIVVVAPLISQLELGWEEPALEHFWSRFAACAQLGGFDFEADPDQVGEWATSTARAWGSGEVFGARAPYAITSAGGPERASRPLSGGRQARQMGDKQRWTPSHPLMAP